MKDGLGRRRKYLTNIFKWSFKTTKNSI